MITNGIVTSIKGTFKKKQPNNSSFKKWMFYYESQCKTKKNIFFFSILLFLKFLDNVNVKGIIMNQNKLNIVTGEECFLITNTFIVWTQPAPSESHHVYIFIIFKWLDGCTKHV